MKLLTVTIPCYNSESYMEKCIKSVLVGGEQVEILIVDDGSSDRTAEIADRYAAKHPTIIRAIHQENGGHGDAVNTGLRNATGIYFKVVDSDDWLDETAFHTVLERMNALLAADTAPDMMLANYVYEKVGARHKKVMRQSDLPTGKLVRWQDIRKFHVGHYMMMHAVIYKTELLRKARLDLPKHTFYVDNIYVYDPLPLVKTLYYLDVDLYRYFIGRADQSVNEPVLLKRIDQQILVNRRMMDDVDLWTIGEEQCRRYMINYLEILTAATSVLLFRIGTPDAVAKKNDLWQHLRERDERLYRVLRRRPIGRAVHLPGKIGRKAAVIAYLALQKIVGFN